MVNAELRLFCHDRLGVEGNTGSGGTQHAQIVGTIAHRDEIFRRKLLFFGHALKGVDLCLFSQNGFNHPACQLAVLNFQPVCVVLVKPERRCNMARKQAETAGNQDAVAVGGFHRGEQNRAAGGKGDALLNDFTGNGVRQSGQQGNPFAQCRFELDFTVHGPCRNGGDLVLQPHLGSQFIDAFLINHGRIHVGNQCLLAPCSPVLQGNVDGKRADDRADRRQDRGCIGLCVRQKIGHVVFMEPFAPAIAEHAAYCAHPFGVEQCLARRAQKGYDGIFDHKRAGYLRSGWRNRKGLAYRRCNVKRPVLIAGPTASGKSALAMQLARAGGAVINADSMQVYGVLEVVTARPGEAETEGVPHHLFGHVDPREAYSVARWLDDVKSVLDGLCQNTMRPVFAGGTGLYFKALLEGLSLIPPVDPEIRQSLREAAKSDVSALYRELEMMDPESWRKIKPGDGQRIVRALEVVRSTGKPLSWWQIRDKGEGVLAGQNAIRIVLEPDRARLREKIAERFKTMMERGAIEETRALLALDAAPELPAMRAIGVREIRAFIDGEISRDKAVELAITATAQYAKRQSTWFRNQFGADWHRFTDAEAAHAWISDQLQRAE